MDWADSTFGDIDWKNLCSSFKNLSTSRWFQLAKYAHDWTPTLHQCATQDNSIDRQCFHCSTWKEDINHVLHCSSDQRDAARTKTQILLLDHFTAYHTPALMDKVIMTALDWWFQNLCPNLVLHHISLLDPTIPTNSFTVS
jgi:hypothetical protein